MVKPYWYGMDDRGLLERLKSTSELLHEVGDGRRPYRPDEHNGVDRGTCYRELAAEVDLMIAECEARKLDWYEAYWGEPRPSPRTT